MTALTPALLGAVFTMLACMQHVHSNRGMWGRAMLVSLGIGAIQYLMVRWAARGDASFWYFQAGCAVGAGLGTLLSSRIGGSTAISRRHAETHERA